MYSDVCIGAEMMTVYLSIIYNTQLSNIMLSDECLYNV